LCQGATVKTSAGRDLTSAAPEVEDGIHVGTGAKILGGVRIGQGPMAGANAVVMPDLMPGSTVIGANRLLTSRNPCALD
jgi:serine acetyltransferase